MLANVVVNVVIRTIRRHEGKIETLVDGGHYMGRSIPVFSL